MPRPPRVHLEGALYYVVSRAVDGSPLFRDHEDYEAYVKLLEEYRAEFHFKLFSFVLLPDHLQLCIELTNRTTISDIMHALNSRYTKYYNKRYGHSGHLFQERFKSTIMEKAPSLLRITAYLHTSPVRSALADDLREYPWSSYPDYLLPAPPLGGAQAGAASAPVVPETAQRGMRLVGPSIRGEVREVLEQLSRERPGSTYEEYLRSFSEAEREELCADLQRWAVGSAAFLALVKERSLAIPQSALQPTRPSPLPQPGGPRRPLSLLVTGSVALAFISLCAVGLYAKNLNALRQTVRILAQERTMPFMQALPQASGAVPTAQLATLNVPSRLSGTSWEIQIRAVTERGEVIQRDRLEFRGGKVTSSQLGAQGFAPSNYTMSVQENGTVVWETMQANKAGAVVCWRGEWVGETMRGVMTRQASGAPVMNFSFIGTAKPQRDMDHTTSEI